MRRLACLIIALGLAPGLSAEPKRDADELLRELRRNDSAVQNLKTRAVNILAAVQDHKNQYFHPPEQRLDVYLSSPARLFSLESLELSSAGQRLLRQDFDEQQVYAMRIGGVAPLFHGNVSPGRFALDVYLQGRNADGEPVDHRATMTLTKSRQPLTLELRVKDVPGGSGVGLDALEREAR